MNDRQVSERDDERNEDPQTIAGAVGGTTGAGVGAGLGLVAGGPLGAAIGALAGAAGGWWASRGAEQAIEDMDRADNRFRRAHEHAGATRPYEEARHGYQLGYVAGRNSEYADREFSHIENDLRDAWVQAHLRDGDPLPWEDVRASAREGFELARGAD
ncbi:MAG TPA: hypothetical protein VMN39_11645 [Longimicrobiaceae bacterium]|nr:hypothetical protein [Longimicrobiaceae bacterium]